MRFGMLVAPLAIAYYLAND